MGDRRGVAYKGILRKIEIAMADDYDNALASTTNEIKYISVTLCNYQLHGNVGFLIIILNEVITEAVHS